VGESVVTLLAGVVAHPDRRTAGVSRAELIRYAAGTAAAYILGASAQAQPADVRMETRPIPATGEKLPVVGCGTWQTFDVGNGAAARQPLSQVLKTLFETGGSVVDSSPMYGASEAVVGDLLAEAGSRSKAFIATKIWTRGREAGIEQLRHSMQLLRTDKLDLIQVHNLVDWKVHLKTLRSRRDDGSVRYVGVTHYTASAYAELEAVLRSERLDFVQVNYSADDRGADQRILPLAAERGTAVLVNLPFGGGGLLRRLRGRPVPAWAAEIECTTWAQLLLKFVIGHPAVTCVIPGTRDPEHMRENSRAGTGKLPHSAMRAQIVAALDA
jgi:diketogulonate reductase-like aldo/keto reductase